MIARETEISASSSRIGSVQKRVVGATAVQMSICRLASLLEIGGKDDMLFGRAGEVSWKFATSYNNSLLIERLLCGMGYRGPNEVRRSQRELQLTDEEVAVL